MLLLFLQLYREAICFQSLWILCRRQTGRHIVLTAVCFAYIPLSNLSFFKNRGLVLNFDWLFFARLHFCLWVINLAFWLHSRLFFFFDIFVPSSQVLLNEAGCMLRSCKFWLILLFCLLLLLLLETRQLFIRLFFFDNNCELSFLRFYHFHSEASIYIDPLRSVVSFVDNVLFDIKLLLNFYYVPSCFHLFPVLSLHVPQL
jgi:hypothetical protein